MNEREFRVVHFKECTFIDLDLFIKGDTLYSDECGFIPTKHLENMQKEMDNIDRKISKREMDRYVRLFISMTQSYVHRMRGRIIKMHDYLYDDAFLNLDNQNVRSLHFNNSIEDINDLLFNIININKHCIEKIHLNFIEYTKFYNYIFIGDFTPRIYKVENKMAGGLIYNIDKSVMHNYKKCVRYNNELISITDITKIISDQYIKVIHDSLNYIDELFTGLICRDISLLINTYLIDTNKINRIEDIILAMIHFSYQCSNPY